MSKSKFTPTNSELEILSVFWGNGPLTARQVHDILEKTKDTGYTTTLKIIQNMYDKGFLSREPEGRTHVYDPIIKEESVQENMLTNFVNLLFNGSSKNLILSSLGNQKTTKEDLKEIKKMLEVIEKRENND